MSDLFKNKYRISSARYEGWNYGWNAAYFVTICIKDFECWFGQVQGEKVQLSKFGVIAEQCWFEIPMHFKFVKLDQYVIMPNHVHGIIIIKHKDAPEANHYGNKFGPQSNNLASIIRGFKIGVTKKARKIDTNFCWQPRYYEHIIQSEQSFHMISEYIINNPRKWKEDKLYRSNDL